ncbi:MAG: AAA family ATPase [Roseburia sp.]|nr:AAA family ATPase [Anaeroplasma bactoclasticum]MCM1196945.1 AAA family ATPase [Roseburia sp.]MCM1557447.1 AAA family ATPase [Anaeroplasma bactoclasticum]
MKYFTELNVKAFRGINNLHIKDLRDINIIVGDNNVDKTSILEAVQLFRDYSFYNILKVMGNRKRRIQSSLFLEFLNAFPKNRDTLEISVSTFFKNELYAIKLIGSTEMTLLEMNDLPKYAVPKKNKEMSDELKEILSNEVLQFKGNLTVTGQMNNLFHENSYPILYNPYVRPMDLEKQESIIKMVYLSPIDYMLNDVFNSIIVNEKYKEICLKVLQIFDNDIEDLILLKDDKYNMATEYIRSKRNGNLPLTSYGDGIKKILSIANGIAQAHDGILLIDELENAIHAKYYDDIFNFIIKPVKQFNVQLFITTHSIEALDGLLSTQNYEQDNEEMISVITLRKDGDTGDTLSRTLNGKEVKKDREDFGFEVRE